MGKVTVDKRVDNKIFNPWRMIWHVFGGIIPILYYFAPLAKVTVLAIIVFFFLLFLAFDIIRLRIPSLNQKFITKYSFLIREYEKTQFNTTTYFLLSSFLSILLFPKDIAVVVLCFLAFGDTIASFIGSTFGRIKIFDKTIEGSMACFLVCFIIANVLLGFRLSLIGALVATFAELLPLKINDNLLIPLISGTIMTMVY